MFNLDLLVPVRMRPRNISAALGRFDGAFCSIINTVSYNANAKLLAGHLCPAMQVWYKSAKTDDAPTKRLLAHLDNDRSH